jgi:hypothetical protein
MEDFGSAGEAEIRFPRRNMIHGPGCAMTPVKPDATALSRSLSVLRKTPNLPVRITRRQ